MPRSLRAGWDGPRWLLWQLSGRTIATRMSVSLGGRSARVLRTLAFFFSTACGRPEIAPMADVTAGEHGFSPPSLRLTQGGPASHASVTFLRTSDKTCATEVVFPDLKVEQKLPLNQVVSIEVPTDTAQTLTFQCGMGMYKGAIVVSSR